MVSAGDFMGRATATGPTEREKKVAKLFKYIAPSYYLKGFMPWQSKGGPLS